MKRKTIYRLLPALLLSVSCAAMAQEAPAKTAPVEPQARGSTAFCLYELPSDGGKRRWLNLGIVQQIEASGSELRITYGGGNFGSGHEVRIPAGSQAQLDEALDRILVAAANCR